ncbi:MAG: hypothetical protein Fur0032_20630 [Terrimicrobiaceae bacterium]
MNPTHRERHTDFNETQSAWVSLFLAFVLSGMAVVFFFAGEGGLFSYVAILPGFFGLLLAYGFIHSLLASATPPTTILLATETLSPGKESSLTIRQQGPVRMESLRANLVCEKSVRRGKNRDLTYPHQIPVFDSGPFDVTLQDTREFSAVIPVPSDAEPTH